MSAASKQLQQVLDQGARQDHRQGACWQMGKRVVLQNMVGPQKAVRLQGRVHCKCSGLAQGEGKGCSGHATNNGQVGWSDRQSCTAQATKDKAVRMRGRTALQRQSSNGNRVRMQGTSASQRYQRRANFVKMKGRITLQRQLTKGNLGQDERQNCTAQASNTGGSLVHSESQSC